MIRRNNSLVLGICFQSHEVLDVTKCGSDYAVVVCNARKLGIEQLCHECLLFSRVVYLRIADDIVLRQEAFDKGPVDLTRVVMVVFFAHAWSAVTAHRPAQQRLLRSRCHVTRLAQIE